MIASPIYSQQPFRVTIMVCLVLLIGLKIMVPVFKVTIVFAKEVKFVAETQSDTDKTEKEGGTDHYYKFKEYNSIHAHIVDNFLSYTQLNHSSQHKIDYKSSYYYKITTPPPDFCLYLKT